jgi:putative ABC transport system permease protein
MWMGGLLQDLRYALRQLHKNPAFTAVIVITLALGIGASTTMFGVLNAVLLQPIPFHDAGRLVRIFSTQNDSVQGPSPLDVRDFAAQSHTFEKFAVYDIWPKNVSLGGESIEPEQLRVGLVSADYFEVLGVTPLMGRLFKDEENRWGNQYEVILGYDFWQTRFHGDRSILGQTIRINDEPYTIIAVMPGEIRDGFSNTYEKLELWTPFVPYSSANKPSVWDEAQRGSRGWGAIGRLKAGVSLAQAQADLQAIAAGLAARYPLDRGVSASIRPLQEDRVGNLRPLMIVLMGAVILILLIACSNVANLLLARNSARAREVAVRVAMGAARSVLIRQFMVESLLLGIIGGFVGCALAWWACVVVARLHPAQLPALAGVHVDFRVLVFALAISVASSVIFGVAPAYVSSKANLSEAFKDRGRGNIEGRGKQRLRRSFVAGELALAVMLLVGTGLLIQSLLHLQNQQMGFRVDHLLRTHFYLPAARYPDPVSVTRFCEEYAARVRMLPGVQDATVSASYPFDDQWTQNFTIVGRAVSRLEETPSAAFDVTDSHQLHTLGISLLKGRTLADTDIETTPPVALINQAFADRYFPTEDPIGKQIRMGLDPILAASTTSTPFTIVGVIGNFMNRGVALPPLPHVTTLARQTPLLNAGFKYLIVRTSLDPLQLAPPIRRELHSLDANLPFAEVSTVEEIMEQQTADRRYTTRLLALFAVFGVLLAGIGVYGVVSFLVAQRTTEIGVRMALGAQREDVLWSVMKQGLTMAAIGAVIGLFGAWILRQFVAQLVFGISPVDPATFLGASLLLIFFAAMATYIPARRATKVDPMVALRYE